MKNKKYIIIWLLLLLLNFTYAQTTIGDVEVKFCNNWEITNELDLVSIAWENTPLCVEFSNAWEYTYVNIDFLDSVLTQDENALRACNAWDRPKTTFGNFMKDYEKTLFLAWKSKIQKTYEVNFPAWFKWQSHGCLAYNLISDPNKDDEWWSMFNIVVRKVKFIDVFVWETQVTSVIKPSGVKTIKEDWKINFELWLKNEWNTVQDIEIKAEIFNIFWFKQQLELNNNTFKINPKDEIKITTNNENLTLPLYKWFFTIKFDIINKPNFDFNIWNSDIPQDVILWWTFTEKKLVFIPNFYFFWIVIIFLILIYLSIFKRPKTKIIKIK